MGSDERAVGHLSLNLDVFPGIQLLEEFQPGGHAIEVFAGDGHFLLAMRTHGYKNGVV
jgi:hypothetical protein